MIEVEGLSARYDHLFPYICKIVLSIDAVHSIYHTATACNIPLSHFKIVTPSIISSPR